ncbi:MAG: beta-ketoacyl-ACP synthase III [Actinomycetota bacterium]
MSARRASIVGVGSCLPERIVRNADFEATLETNDEWIRERTGIRERRFVVEGEATSDLATGAARAALEMAGVAPEQLDLIVVATCTPDNPLPSTGIWVQRKLGAHCPAFDVNSACAGFSYALSTGSAFLESGQAETVLVIGAEVLSRWVDMDDRSTAILFGDGAGAVILRPSDEPGVLGSVLGADGNAAEVLIVPTGGTARPSTPERVAAHENTIKMPNGREVFKRAVVEMASACRELLEKSGYTPADVDLLIPHQANARIMVAVAERLGIPEERAVLDVEEVGNTSAASVPIALDRAFRAGRIDAGDLVLITSFGAGLTWGANLIRWNGISR